MENVSFWKMSGSGNDFMIIDNRDGRIDEEGMSLLVERDAGAGSLWVRTASSLWLIPIPVISAGGFSMPTAGRWRCAVTGGAVFPVSPS